MKYKISFLVACLVVLGYQQVFFEEKDESKNSTSVSAPLEQKNPDDDLGNLQPSISPLVVNGVVTEGFTYKPPVTYKTLSPELQGKLTYEFDTSAKVRRGGYRHEPADPDVLKAALNKTPQEPPHNKSLISSFNAGGQITNGINTGSSFIPADPHGAAGPNHVVNVFNTSIEFYDNDGTNGSSASLQSFFAPLTPVNFTFDPKVLYDQYEDRFVVVTIERTDTSQGAAANTSRLLVAVSDDSNPNGTWYMHSINSNVVIGGAARWFDYPGFAVDEEVIYISGNMFGYGGGGFGGVRLWMIEKTGFYANGSVTTIGPLDPYNAGASGAQVTSQPAHTYGTVPAGMGTYLVSYSRLANGAGTEFWQTVRIDNPTTAPVFVQQFIAVGDIEPNVGGLPVAPQSGTGLTLMTNDPRALDAVWRDNKIYSTATIESNSELNETSVSWWVFNGNGVAGVSVNESGIIDGEDIATGTFTFFPSIAVNDDGGIGVGFSASAPTIFPGSYFADRSPTDAAGTMRSSKVVRAGTDFYHETFGFGNNRWGDYSSLSLDPNGECFWAYNKHAVNRSSGAASENGLYETAYGEFCNQAPSAGGNGITVDENGTITTVNNGDSTVLNNDSDPDTDDTLTTLIVTPPVDASAFVFNLDGTFSYTHNGDEAASDSFVYEACDNGSPIKCTQANVNITINPINDDPTAVNDTADTDEDTMVSVAVLTGDSDPDVGDTLSVTSCTGASNGVVVLNGDNCEFTPSQDFNGQGSFNYAISDNNGGTDSASVTVTVDAVNDDPSAVNDTADTDEDTMVSVAVLTGDSDPDVGDTLSVTSCTGASNGVVVLNGDNCEFTPSQDFNGQGSFNYAISDNNGGTDSASVTVDVTEVNDEPSMMVNATVYVALEDFASPPAQNLACQFDFGPDDEDASQSVADMNVSIINDPDNILNSIDVDNNGALVYDFSGTVGLAEVTVSLEDDGGVDNGGENTSVEYTFLVNLQDYVFRDDFESDTCQ